MGSSEQVLLREATLQDLELMMAWRNNPRIYQGFYTQGYLCHGPLTWEEHHHWWSTRHNWKIFIILVGENFGEVRSVGVVSFSQLDCWKPQIGIYIGEVTLWGKRVGKQALTQALLWAAQRGRWTYGKVWTTILKSNERAIRLFESVGFKRVGEGREGEWEYEIIIDRHNLTTIQSSDISKINTT